MSATLKTDLGKIEYNEPYIASIAGYSALECYGLVGMSQKNITEMISNLFKGDNLKKGVKIKTDGSENVIVELYITVKYGVSLAAVADKVKYSIEKETGLNVQSVDIIVQGIQI